MRNARFISSLGRKALGAVLAGGFCFVGWGCHQHHHYYGSPSAANCPPGTAMTSSIASGPVCEVPSDVGNGSYRSDSPRSTIVSDGGSKTRVVVSEPSSSNGKSKFSWRASDVESAPAMTHVDGALDDSTVK